MCKSLQDVSGFEGVKGERPDESTDPTASVVEARGQKRSWTEGEVMERSWHYVAVSESLKRLQETISQLCRDPSLLEMLVP